MTSHLKKPSMDRTGCCLTDQRDGKVDTPQGQALHQVMTGVGL
jgi:hypothetical protein